MTVSSSLVPTERVACLLSLCCWSAASLRRHIISRSKPLRWALDKSRIACEMFAYSVFVCVSIVSMSPPPRLLPQRC